MNDEFLTKLRRTPRPAYTEALYQRLARQSQPGFVWRLGRRLTFRNAVIAFVLLFLVAARVYAMTGHRWDKVGGIWVEVQRTLKFDYNPEEPQYAGEPECLSIEDARKILRFDVHIPTWAPAGFTLDDRICGIDRLSDFAGLYWKGGHERSGINIMSQNLRMFNMSTQKYEISPAVVWSPVAPGSYQEVQVHGQPAVLVHGDWEEPYMTEDILQLKRDREFKWDKKRGLQLHWVDGDVMYHLSTYADVSAEDLIRMAESAR